MPIKKRVQVDAYKPERIKIPSVVDNRVFEIEVENMCGICGEVFDIKTSNPHTRLISLHLKNKKGPICPSELK
jgi:hypothetical protein